MFMFSYVVIYRFLSRSFRPAMRASKWHAVFHRPPTIRTWSCAA